MRHLSFLPVLLIVFITAGCASLKEETDETKDWTAEKLYQEAKSVLHQGDHETAINYLEKLEARYPYGRYAAQAQLDVAYAYHRSGESTMAIAAAERFIRLHPTHPFVDYAYYLKGLVSFNIKRGPFDWILGSGRDYSDRDPQAMREALETFEDLIRRFPESKYVADAQQRITYLINLMAKSEIHVARHYFRRGAYVAAVNRSKYVLEKFQHTPAVEDALGIQSMAYAKMGLTELTQDSLRILQKNFPKSRYIRKIAALGNDQQNNDNGEDAS